MAQQSIILIHDCSKCKLKKHKIEVEVDPTDIKVYHQLQTRMDNATQAALPSTLDALTGSLEISEDEKRKYFQEAFKNFDEVKQLYVEWWTLMREKYGINESAKVSYEENAFFECLDENGVPDITGNFRPINKEE